MMIKVSDYIADFLVDNGITECFTVTGGGAMHLNDSFGHKNGLHCTYNHHEQACSMAAEGYTRFSGRISAVCVTSGPGSTNTITGVMGAWLDSIPMIIFSGQMKYSTTIASTNLPLRQLGFQEFNIVDSISCMTKYSVLISNPNDVVFHLEKALYLCKEGRPGPVWLDIPLDVQASKIDLDTISHYNPLDVESCSQQDEIDRKVDELLLKLNNAKKPVILAGNGIRIGKAEPLFLQVIDKLKIPVVTAWNAHDLIWDTHPYYCGRPGTIGTRGGNFVVQNSDLLISFGCRMNIRQISYEWKNFAKNAYKIAVDIDDAELKKPTLSIDLPIHADIKKVFMKILTSTIDANSEDQSKWLNWCHSINKKYPIVLKEYYLKKTPLNPYVFMKELSDSLNEQDVIVASNGTACVCSFQTIEIHKNQRMFTNAGASSMGYGLPAAIGVSMSTENAQRVICLEGDGSIQMNLQELQTIVHNNLNIKIFWINNNGYHSIRQTQSQIFDANKRGYCGVSSESGLSFPSAEKIAYAYGIRYVKLNSVDNLSQRINEAISGDDAVICEVVVDPEQDFAPKLTSKMLSDGSFNTPSLEDMYPFLSPKEMESNYFR